MKTGDIVDETGKYGNSSMEMAKNVDEKRR